MEKDKTLAGILSFLMPGLGQIYVGSTIRGIVWFIIYFGILVATVMDGIFFFVLLTAMFLSIWDAVNEAEICNGRKIRKGEELKNDRGDDSGKYEGDREN